MGKLDNRVADVTGSARGLRRRTAQALGREGAFVVCADVPRRRRRRGLASRRRGRCPGRHRRRCGRVDVRPRRRRHGSLDILANNAGVAQPIADARPAEHLQSREDRSGELNAPRSATPRVETASGGVSLIAACFYQRLHIAATAPVWFQTNTQHMLRYQARGAVMALRIAASGAVSSNSRSSPIRFNPRSRHSEARSGVTGFDPISS